jgi:hypothetical protein
MSKMGNLIGVIVDYITKSVNTGFADRQKPQPQGDVSAISACLLDAAADQVVSSLE